MGSSRHQRVILLIPGLFAPSFRESLTNSAVPVSSALTDAEEIIDLKVYDVNGVNI